MIVVDANVIVYRAVIGGKTTLARQVAQVDSDWAVPLLCKHELANVLLQQMKQNRLSREDLPAAWTDFEAIIGNNEHAVSLPSVALLAHERGITAYDAQYVWLAQDLSIKLITEDRELLASSPREALSMEQFIEAASGQDQ